MYPKSRSSFILNRFNMDYACTKKIFEGKLPISVLKKTTKTNT